MTGWEIGCIRDFIKEKRRNLSFFSTTSIQKGYLLENEEWRARQHLLITLVAVTSNSNDVGSMSGVFKTSYVPFPN